MAYKLKRSKRIRETIELCDESGAVARSVEIDLDAEQIAKAFNVAYNRIIRAEQAIQQAGNKPENSEQIYSEFGAAIVAMFVLVFGEPNAGVIVEHYEGRYVEMAEEVFPFIRDVVQPKIRDIMTEKRAKAAAKYKADQRFRLLK